MKHEVKSQKIHREERNYDTSIDYRNYTRGNLVTTVYPIRLYN